MKIILDLPEPTEKHDLHVEIVPAAPPTEEQASYVPTYKGMAAHEDKKLLERLSALESKVSTSGATTNKVGSEATAPEEATTTKASPEVTTTKSSPK